ncbi:MAG: M48 family metalloprotease [Gammaproteobacteria bacterium]|jgi:predicted Zn-dependent protease
MRYLFCVFAILGTLLAGGCATNPVTGKTQLNLISRADEIRIGEQQYLPARQMQGGDYVVDRQLVAYVRQVGQRLASVSDRPDLPYEFHVLDNNTPNAWALPGGKIAINRGLLVQLQSEAELAAVLGHEIVHAAAGHTAQAIQRGLLLQAGIAAVAASAADERYAGAAIGGAGIAAQLISQKYSREAELEADRYGMQYMKRAGYDPSAAISLQQTFVKLFENRRADWLEGLFASHPPSRERVEANRRTLDRLGAGGRMGSEDYQQQIARLKRDQPAYAAYQRAEQALRDGRPEQARTLARQAIAMEPAAPHFYGLLAALDLQAGRNREALAQATRALERNPAYFAFHLEAGIAQLRLDETAAARQSLERSNRLLPTATAHEALGRIALSENRQDEAIAHFRAAAGSDSPAGARARTELQRLGVPPR